MEQKKRSKMTDLSSFYDDMKNQSADAGGGGNKITVAGDHLCEVERCVYMNSQLNNDTLFVIEYQLKESTCANDVNVDSSYSVVLNFSRKFGNNRPDVSRAKQFVAATQGWASDTEEANAIDGEDFEAIKADPELLKGKRFRLTTIPKKTKEGRDWVANVFAPC